MSYRRSNCRLPTPGGCFTEATFLFVGLTRCLRLIEKTLSGAFSIAFIFGIYEADY